MLSLLSCFFDDNERQPWTTLFGNRNVVFVVCVVNVVVTCFEDNEGQLSVVCGKQNTKRVMIKQKKSAIRRFLFFVPMRRLELPRASAHYTLNVACLPISPHGLCVEFLGS